MRGFSEDLSKGGPATHVEKPEQEAMAALAQVDFEVVQLDCAHAFSSIGHHEKTKQRTLDLLNFEEELAVRLFGFFQLDAEMKTVVTSEPTVNVRAPTVLESEPASLLVDICTRSDRVKARRQAETHSSRCCERGLADRGR